MNESKKLTAAIYTRVSSKGQAKEGNGLDVQLEKCKAALTIKSWSFYKLYSNPDGISGTTKYQQRKEFMELIKDAEEGKFQVIVVASLDRLGRTLMIIEKIKKKLESLGVQMYSCAESIDTTTPAGNLILQMLSGFAEYDRTIIVKRLREGIAMSFKKRGERGGPLPYGYKRTENKTIEINEDEAKVVRYIFQEHKKGKSLRQIAKVLTDAKIKARKSSVWHPSTIKSILDHFYIYLGCIRNGNESMICWPKILSGNGNGNEDGKNDIILSSDEVLQKPPSKPLPPPPDSHTNSERLFKPLPTFDGNISDIPISLPPSKPLPSINDAKVHKKPLPKLPNEM